MQGPPQISPDGAYWWDGRSWQPMPPSLAGPPASAPPPSWLPAGVQVPSPASPPIVPVITAPGVAVAAFAPAWAGEAPPSSPGLSITKKILMCVGAGLSGGVLLLGLLGIGASLSQSGDTRAVGLIFALTFAILGAAIFAPCLGVLLGFGPVVSTTLHSLGILGCIVVFGMVLNTAVAVAEPVGGGRYVFPWGTAALIAFRMWRGRWLGAGIILVTWMVAMIILLTLGRP